MFRAIFIVAALSSLLSGCGDSLGVSNAHPLGEFDSIDECLLAEFDTGSVKGRWEKVPTTQRASDTNTLWDQALIWRK